MKKRVPHIILGTLLLSCTFINAEIREATCMQEIVPFVDDSTLLVVDIDNTLIEPEGNLGSDQWYYFLVRKYMQFDHRSEKEANEEAMQVWNKTQWLINVNPVEKDTPGFIKQLQDIGVRIMGVTARTLNIIDKTFSQLESTGIYLNRSPVHGNIVDFRSDDLARYERGVLFVGENNNKGKALVQFLEQCHYLPAKIVFIDDKMRHVESVEKALSKVNIQYLGFRYGAADKKVRLFNEDTKDIDLFADGVLTDTAKENIEKAQANRDDTERIKR